jgi:hypothetical protein
MRKAMIKIAYLHDLDADLPATGAPNHGVPNHEASARGVPSRGASSPRAAALERRSTVRHHALTKEQVFRLWQCAIKDDDELVDEIIERVYENIVAFDYKRAESVIELVVRRSVTARWVFRSLLKDMRAH